MPAFGPENEFCGEARIAQFDDRSGLVSPLHVFREWLLKMRNLKLEKCGYGAYATVVKIMSLNGKCNEI